MDKFTTLIIIGLLIWIAALVVLAYPEENWAGGWKTGLTNPSSPEWDENRPEKDAFHQGIHSYPGVDRQPVLEDYLGRIMALEAENQRLQDEILFWKSMAYELLEMAKRAERKLNYGQ